jgi:tetratricopeptide (TPR) repeat protein
LQRRSSRNQCIFPHITPASQATALTWGSEKFTQAIAIEPANHVLHSNRSGAYASLKDFAHALEDANKVTEIKPDWAKGWGRKGTALHGQGDLGECNSSKLRLYTCH